MTVVLLVIVLALWSAAILRLSTAKTGPSQAFGRSVLALAIAGTVYLPVVSTAITAVTFIGMASVLLYVAAAAAAIEMLEFMLWTTDPAAAARMTSKKRWAVLLGVGALLSVSVLLGHPTATNLSLPWINSGWQYVFWIFWLGFVALTTGRMLLVCIRYVRNAGPSPLRTAQILLGGAAASGLVYSIARLGCWISNNSGVFEIGAKLSVIGLLAFLAAASVWALIATLPATRRRSDWRAITRLQPLWDLLEPTKPAAALHPLPTTRPSSSSDTRFALYRAVVEIRDWMYSLSAYVDADTWQQCLDNSGEERNDQRVLAEATAAWLATALHARELGRPAGSKTVCPPASEDIDADIRLLCEVAMQLQTIAPQSTTPQVVTI